MDKKNFLDKSGVSYLWQRIMELLRQNNLKNPQPVDNKLIYSENSQFVNDYLMRNDDILVVDNDADFEKCTQVSDIETDVLGAWQQFTDYKTHSPEYGSGNVTNSSSYGYGRWYSDGTKILNPINSNDFNGYILPFAKSSYSIESVLGTEIGNTTGDNIGFSIVNDKNAIPKHVKTESGKIYYRNTLYDIIKSKATSTSKQIPLKSAWVCEDMVNNNAYVIYIDSPTSGNESYPTIGTNYNVYLIDNIKTSIGRKKYNVDELNDNNSVFTEKIETNVDASGVIDFVTLTVTNSSSMQIGHGTSVTNTGTIYVYGSRYTISSGLWTNQLVFGGNAGDLGRLLVEYDENLDTNSTTQYNSTLGVYKPCVIKTLSDFSNGILTVEFSKAINPLATDYNIGNAEYKSSLIIDFNKKVYSIKTIDGDTNSYSNRVLPTSVLEDDFWSGFTQETKFMYHAYSYQNLYIECLNIAIDNIVLHVDKTSAKYGVWGLNEERNDYVKLLDIDNSQIDPCEYLTGSKMSYNRLTKKLFYSDGENIYQVAEGIIDRDSLKGDPGEPGVTGVGLEYEWDGTQLGVKREDEGAFNYTDLIGPGLEYTWDGTYLGVKKEGDSSFEYTDLIGPQGPTGDSGIGFGYLGCSWDQHEVIMTKMYFDNHGGLQTLTGEDEEIPDGCVKVLDKFPGLSTEHFSYWLDNIYNWLNHTSNTFVFEKYINYLTETAPDIYSDLPDYLEEIEFEYISMFVQSNIDGGLISLILPITPWGDFPVISVSSSSIFAFRGNIHSYRGGNSILFYEDEITTDINNKADVPTSFSVRVGDLVIDENFNLYKCIEE